MKTRIFALALSSTILFSSCLGSFTLFKKTLDWNDSVTGEKFINNLIYWGLNIIPVYGAVLFIDGVVLNTIEFWTGDNPVAMKEGEKDVKIVAENGKKYQFTATQNNMNILVLEGENVGEQVDLHYIPAKKAWILEKDGKKIKLSEFSEGTNYVYLPNGKAIAIPADATKEQGLAIVQNSINKASYTSEVAFVK